MITERLKSVVLRTVVIRTSGRHSIDVRVAIDRRRQMKRRRPKKLCPYLSTNGVQLESIAIRLESAWLTRAALEERGPCGSCSFTSRKRC